MGFKSSKIFFHSCSSSYKGIWELHAQGSTEECPAHVPGTGNPNHPEVLPGTTLGQDPKLRATHNVQVGQDVSLCVFFVVQVNIWPCHHHQLQMFDSCLSPLVQARRSPPCWTAQRDSRRVKCTTKSPTDPLPLPKGCNNSAASPLVQGLAQLSHFCWCLSAPLATHLCYQNNNPPHQTHWCY